MTDLARKRAVRAGHRRAITKLTREAEQILSMDFPIEETHRDKVKARLQTIDTMLREKLEDVKGLDIQILELCETTDLSKELEDARVVLDMQHLIAENQRKSLLREKNRHDSVNQQPSTTTNVEKLVMPKFKGDI